MSKRGLFYSIGLALLFVAASFGCEGDKGEIPSSADKRMQQSTQHLPSDTQMAFIFSDLEAFRSNTKASKATIDRLTSTDNLLGTATTSGFAEKFMGDADFQKLLDKQFWKDRGIAPNSSLTLAGVDYNQIIRTYVADKKKFEQQLTDGKKAAKSVKIGDEDAKKLENGGKPIVWTYDGKLVTLAYPGHEIAPPNADRPKTTKTLKRVLKTKKGESLQKSSGFQKFKSAAGDRPTLAYINIDPILDRQNLSKRSEQYKKFVKTLRESLDGGGFIAETSDQERIKTRLWIGLTNKGKKRFDDAFKASVQADWSKYSTSQTLMALRLSLDWKSLWKSFESALPKQQKTMLESQFAKAKKTTGFDLRKDVIENLSTQAGIYVYGIGGEATPDMIGNWAQTLQDLEALYVMKFGDAETLSKIAESVAGMSDKYLKLRSMKLEQEGDSKKVESVQVLEMKMPAGGMQQLMTGRAPTGGNSDAEPQPAPIRGYVHEDTLMVAASALSEERIHHLLTGEGEGPERLGDLEKLDLGASFSKTKQLTGLYVNFVRFRNIFAKILSARMVPANIKNVATTLQEALLATNPQKNGVFVDLTLDLEPTTGDSGGSKGSKGSKEKGSGKSGDKGE